MPIDRTTVCCVTGGTSGIGLAIARCFAERGARVAICGRSPGRVERAVAELIRSGDVSGFQCDVSDPAAVATFARGVQAELGAPDVLVNNAGLAHFAPLVELTAAQIDEVLAVNVRGMFAVTKAFLPGMLDRGRGDIVNIASLAGKNGFANGTAYTASKHAVLGFSKSLMLEVRPRGVRVVAVCPGSVATPFFDDSGMTQPDPDKVLQPEDVAAAVLSAVEMPDRALLSEIDLRPSRPG